MLKLDVVEPLSKQGIITLGLRLSSDETTWPSFISIDGVLFEFMKKNYEHTNHEYLSCSDYIDVSLRGYASWKMSVTILSADGHKMDILCGMLDYSKEWPTDIATDGIVYRYHANQPIPENYVGHYGGCAEYTIQSTYVLNTKRETAMSKATEKATTAKTTTSGVKAVKAPAKKAAAKKPAAKAGATKAPAKKATAATKAKAPVNKAKPLPAKKTTPVEPVAAGTKAKPAKIKPSPKNVAATRSKVAPKPVVGVAKTINVDQLLTLAKSNKKTIAQGGKFTQILQIETTRRSIRTTLAEEINLDGLNTKQLVVGSGTTILLLDAVAAKLIRTVDFGDNVTLKFQRA